VGCPTAGSCCRLAVSPLSIRGCVLAQAQRGFLMAPSSAALESTREGKVASLVECSDELRHDCTAIWTCRPRDELSLVERVSALWCTHTTPFAGPHVGGVVSACRFTLILHRVSRVCLMGPTRWYRRLHRPRQAILTVSTNFQRVPEHAPTRVPDPRPFLRRPIVPLIRTFVSECPSAPKLCRSVARILGQW
jgi:hypothetical protein